MDDLRAAVEGAGLTAVATWLQSGNVVFTDPRSRTPQALEPLLEAAISRRAGVATQVVVRDAQAWREILRRNPFPAFAKKDPSHLLIIPLKGSPDGEAERRVRGAVRGREEVRVLGANAYATYPDGIGRSKLTLQVLEKQLGHRGTARNWNTATKLLELLEG